MNFIKNNRYILFLICLVVWSFMPFLRSISIGAEVSKNKLELLFSNTPELLLGVFLLAQYKLLFKGIQSNLKVFVVYTLIILLGSIVSYLHFSDIMPIIYGIKTTYYPLLIYFIAYEIEGASKEKFLKIWNMYAVIYTLLSVMFHWIYFDFEKSLIEETGCEMPEYYIPRTGGFLLTPVPFAIMIAFSVLYYVKKLISNNNVYDWICLVVLFTGLLYSVTRVGIIGIGIILIYFMIKTKAYMKILKLAALFFILMIIVFKNYKPFVWLLKSSSETIGIRKGVTRVELWKKSIKEFKSHPILGYGIGGAGAGAVKYFKNSEKHAAIHTTDGWFIKILNEIGILGFFILMALFYFIMPTSVFSDRNYLFESAIILFVFIAAVFNNVLDFFPLNALFYFIVSRSYKTPQ